MEIGVYMQARYFNEHGKSAGLRIFTFYVSRMSNGNKLRN